MRKKLFTLISIAAISSLMVAGCGSKPDTTNSSNSNATTNGGTIKIGTVLPLTGGSAVFGEKFKQAYSLALDEINAKGGVKGKKLEIVYEDSQEKPAVGKTAAEKLVSNKDVLILIGGRSSGVTLQEAAVAEENKVPYMIEHGSSDQATMGDKKYVFRLNPTSGMYTDALRKFFKDNPPKSIAYVNVDNAFGEAVYQYGLKGYFEESKVPVTIEKYKAGELDLKPVMEKVKAQNPEVVIMTAGDDNDATQLIKAAKEANLSPKYFVGTGAGHSIIGFAKQAGALADTVLTAGPWHGNKKDPKWQEFNKKFTEKIGHEPGEHEVEGYAAIYVVADALSRAKTLDREGVREALTQTDMDTIFGHVKFEKFGPYSNQNKAISDVSQWIDGKLYTVYPPQNAEKQIVPFKGWK
ncbi:ABC transporter substrate-binding protein [Paradesulfitobacterium aromaticivorans]